MSFFISLRSPPWPLTRIVSAVVMICACLGGDLRAQTQTKGAAEFFEKQVRPILVERCLSCHGPKKAKAGLRLDSRAAVIRGSEQGPVVQPGNSNESRLIQAIRYQGDLKMPPAKRLADAEIAILERWITANLPWPNNSTLELPAAIAHAGGKHWAFQPVSKPPLPKVNDRHWATTPLDSFILAELETAKLRPSPRADRRTLARRASFDLLGLPPAPEECAAFESDPDPNAYENLIDRLLASPRYGERWARHWLDIARYADDKGYVFFEDKSYPWAFTYRDYVIDALNRDVPYDRFVLEQVAADQLAPEDKKAQAAVGFLTVGGHFMNNTHDIIDDRIDLVSRGLMGLTVACARCHDHKFDPIPQADYYSLYGVFRSCREPVLPPLLSDSNKNEEGRKQDALVKSHEQKLVDFVTGKHRELVNGARSRVADYLLAAHASLSKPREDDFMLLADKGDLNPTMITRWRIYLYETRTTPDAVWFPWHRLTKLSEAELAKQSESVLASLRQDPKINRLVRQALPKKTVSMSDLAAAYGKCLAEIDKNWRQALEAASKAGHQLPTKLDDPEAEQLRQILYGRDAPADAPLELDWGFLSLFPDRATQEEYKKLLQNLEASSRKGPSRAMVLLDAPRSYEPRIFERGQPSRLGEAVPRQFLSVANPQRQPFVHGSGRLEMAQEIVARQNPLTARVIVNRLWMHHFGRPLVGTPSDFGLRSEPPSHPALLDWLAADFVDHGWSLKRLHRQMMISATYTQSSLDRADGVAIDPENRHYWRMNRRRLDFESLHDSLLAVSRNIDQSMGGSPVALFDARFRRAVYANVDRLDFPSLLSTFDVPSPAASSPGRISTTVSPQALFMMNGPFVRAAARRLLESQPIQDCKEPRTRIERLFLALFDRKPDDSERQWALDLLATDPSERWLDLIHGLLMTNEFTFVD